MDSKQTDTLYEWVKKVISSCEDLVHIEPCKELIDIFERKNPPAYLVNSLRELIKIYEKSVISSKKKSEKYNLDDKVYELFTKGNSMREIANMLSQKQHVITNIMNNKMKNVKKKSV